MTAPVPHIVELACTYRAAARVATTSWQEFGPFPSREKAWEFIQSYGFTAKDKNEKWMAYPA